MINLAYVVLDKDEYGKPVPLFLEGKSYVKLNEYCSLMTEYNVAEKVSSTAMPVFEKLFRKGFIVSRNNSDSMVDFLLNPKETEMFVNGGCEIRKTGLNSAGLYPVEIVDLEDDMVLTAFDYCVLDGKIVCPIQL